MSGPEVVSSVETGDMSHDNTGSTGTESNTADLQSASRAPSADLNNTNFNQPASGRASSKRVRSRSGSPLFMTGAETPESPAAPARELKRVKTEQMTPPDRHHQIEVPNLFGIDLPANCPRLAAFCPLFAQTEEDIAKICDVFNSVHKELKQKGFNHPEIEEICEQLMQYRDVRRHYPKAKPIALAGPMGAGKSRTINSILDQPGLALDSDSSDRGTNVVHEYLGPEPGQTEKYRVNVVYHSATQLDRRLTTSIESIYKFLELKHSTDDLDGEDENDLRSLYNSALNFFRITLCNREEFCTRENADEFMDDQYESDTKIPTVVNTLHQHFVALKHSRRVVNDVEAHAAHDEDQLSQIFAKVSKPRDPDPKEPHPWPLIEKIQIRVRDSELLRRGAIVSDTPGIADSDQLVVDNTSTYLKNVGIVLLVSPILRTQRLNDLNDILRTCLTTGKAENTYLVMTKIDQKDDLKPHEKAALKPEFRQLIDDAEAQIIKLNEEVGHLRVETNELMHRMHEGPTLVVEFQAKHKRLSELPGEIKKQEDRIFQTTVRARNCDTQELLKGKFRELARSGRAPDLKAIFISNEEYGKLVHNKPARLDKATCGIPDLQTLLFKASANDKFGILKGIIRDNLRVSFRGAILALTQTKLERKAEVESHLRAVLKECSDISSSFKKSIELDFHQSIVEMFNEHEHEWQKKAKRLVSEWETFYASNFTAFCRRSGTWKPRKKGEKSKSNKLLSWNQAINEIFSTELGAAFDQFWLRFDQTESYASTQIREWFTRLIETLKTCPQFQGVAGTPLFYDMLEDACGRTQRSVYGAIESLRHKIAHTQNKAIVENKDKGGFVDLAMQATYQAGLQVQPKQILTTVGKKVKKGNGAHEERVDLIRRKLLGIGEAADVKKEDTDTEVDAQSSIFQSVLEQTKAAFSMRLEAAVEKITTELEATSDGIIKDFNRRYSTEDESTVDPEFKEQLLGQANNALDQLGGRIQQQLNACQQFEEEGEIASPF